MAGRHADRTLDVSIEPELPEMDVDPVLLRRVIDNLLVSDMFDPFWRSERSRSRATGGIGLGLTLV